MASMRRMRDVITDHQSGLTVVPVPVQTGTTTYDLEPTTTTTTTTTTRHHHYFHTQHNDRDVSSSRSLLEQLCDDELALILTFCDFISAVRLARATCRSLRRRLYYDCSSGSNNNNNNDNSNNHNSNNHNSNSNKQLGTNNDYSLSHVWKAIYHRHGFAALSSTMVAPPSCSHRCRRRMATNYLERTRRGRQMDQALFQFARSSSSPNQQQQPPNGKHRFHLPHRRFHFLPVLPLNRFNDNHTAHPPQGMDHHHHHEPSTNEYDDTDDDPPPVDFDCHAFDFTNSSNSMGEFVFLDPFDHSLQIRQLKHTATATSIIPRDGKNGFHPTPVLTWTTKQTLLVSYDDYYSSNNHHFENDNHNIDQVEYNRSGRNNGNRTNAMPNVVDRSMPEIILYFHKKASSVDPPEQHHRRLPSSGSNPHRLQLGIWNFGVDARPILLQQQGIMDNTNNNNPLFHSIGTMISYGRIFIHPIPSSNRQSQHLQQHRIRTSPIRNNNNNNNNNAFIITSRGDHVIEITAWHWPHESNRDSALSSSPPPPPQLLQPEKYIFRVPFEFGALAVCPMTNRVYFSFLSDQMVDRNANNRIGLNIQAQQQQHNPINHCGRFVAAFPFIKFEEGNNSSSLSSLASSPVTMKDGLKYYTDPLFVLDCHHEVSALSIDASGTMLLVGTVQRTLEIWNVVMDATNRPDGVRTTDDHDDDHHLSTTITKVRRLQVIDIPTCIIDMVKLVNQQKSSSSLSSTTRHEPQPSLDQPPAQPPPQHQQPFQRIPCPHPGGVDSFYHPKHMSWTKSGFVTLQHSRTDGSTLLLWMMENRNPNNSVKEVPFFQVVSQISLPLSPQCKPQVDYDGRRLIVYGKDHIGMIILVYHVMGTSLEGIANGRAGQEDNSGGNDSAAGVTNWRMALGIRFANRIRHVALGGFGSGFLDFSSFYMTCSDRYIMVNTKTGHLWNQYHHPPDSPHRSRMVHTTASDGLLVIDLGDDDDEEENYVSCDCVCEK